MIDKNIGESLRKVSVRKILFLDIDGVLNTPDDWASLRYINDVCDPDTTNVINRTKLGLLKMLLDNHDDVEIVISSTWKFLPDGVDRFIETCSDLGFPEIEDKITGKTPNGDERKDEISDWLQENVEGECIYFILDDMYPKHFQEHEDSGEHRRVIHVDGRIGLRVFDIDLISGIIESEVKKRGERK